MNNQEYAQLNNNIVVKYNNTDIAKTKMCKRSNYFQIFSLISILIDIENYFFNNNFEY